jgi:hypothetical protein
MAHQLPQTVKEDNDLKIYCIYTKVAMILTSADTRQVSISVSYWAIKLLQRMTPHRQRENFEPRYFFLHLLLGSAYTQ